MKRKFGLLLAVVFAAVLFIVPMTALADAEGSCGENVTYYYDAENKVLTLTGTGETYNYTSSGNGRSVFYQNAAIRNNCESIVVGEGITHIGNYLFFFLNKVTTAVLPESLESIGDGAFQTCNLMAQCDIPSGVTSIGENAFNSCRALLSVTIPAGVTVIPKQAFNNCIALTSIEIPGTVTTVGQSAFGSCTAAQQIILNEGVETIGMTAFTSSQITSVDIPASVTSLSFDAFNGSNNMTAFNVSADNAVYSDVGGVLFNKAQDTLYKAPAGYTGSYDIPEGTVTVDEDAFNGCAQLTGVSFPSTLTTIGLQAFQYTGLESVNVPANVTEMGTSTFYGSALVSAVINANIEALPTYIFDGCPNLVSVELGAGIQSYSNSAFAYCPLLTSVTVPAGLTEIPEYCFYGCSALPGFEFPDTVTAIGSYAFSDCVSFTEIVLPESMEVIANGAFVHCAGITRLTIPAGVTRIESMLCSRCEQLSSVEILGDVTFFGGNAFGSCSLLTSVVFRGHPFTQESVGYNPFGYNNTSVEIHYPNTYPDWERYKPFDKNGAEFTYIADRIAASVEFMYVALRERPTDDGLRDMRFWFRLTNMEGSNVVRRYITIDCMETGSHYERDCVKNFASGVDGTVIFTGVLQRMPEEMFDYHITCQAFLDLDGIWTGTAYSLTATATVDDLINAD